jgi:hypothetical protein
MFEHHDKQILEVLERIERRLKEFSRFNTPRSAILTIASGIQGDDMPATIQVGGSGAKAIYQEFDGPNGTGNPVKPVGTVAFASDNPSVATVDQQGNVTAVSPGTANISASDSGAPAVPAAHDAVTVVAGNTGTPVSATLTITANGPVVSAPKP